MYIKDENSTEALDVPGRKLKWLFHPDQNEAENCSMNVVEIAVGETVKPAHSHPDGEEIIYVVSGTGKVLVLDEVRDLEAGNAVLFPKGAAHMVRNTGTQPLKLACFFSPKADFAAYRYHEEIEFPGEEAHE